MSKTACLENRHQLQRSLCTSLCVGWLYGNKLLITLSSTLQVKLPSKNVESYTKTTPVSLSQSTLKYGDYGPKEPFAREELRLHFENNTPFAVATSLVREVEISHWGNVYMEEHYTIKHVGAKIRVRLHLIGKTACLGYKMADITAKSGKGVYKFHHHCAVSFRGRRCF